MVQAPNTTTQTVTVIYKDPNTSTEVYTEVEEYEIKGNPDRIEIKGKLGSGEVILHIISYDLIKKIEVAESTDAP